MTGLTPHPEPHNPAGSMFGTLDGQEIDACLPFHLVDGDDAGTARVLAGTDLEISPDLLAMILFAATRPGDLGPGDDLTRWGLVADAVLMAGAVALTLDYQRMRTVADQHPDPDALLWWEDCRDQVRRMFAGRPIETPHTDQYRTDESAEEA